MSKLSSFDELGQLFNVTPSSPEESSDEQAVNIDLQGLELRIWLKRLKGNKVVSSIEGFDAAFPCAALAKILKQHCGSGGAAKNNTIIIQGDHRERLLKYLNEQGAKTKLAGS